MDTQYRRILTPLDGSDIAQSAVAAAAGLSRLFDSELTLITVLPENADAPQPVGALKGNAGPGTGVSDPPASDVTTGGMSYVERMANELKLTGVNATPSAIMNPDAATEIVLTARDLDVGLIVMATRGRSGIVRGLLGSVTDRVIHSSPMPVMVVPSNNKHDLCQWTPQSIIVPLDGSELAETALPHVEAIASAANIPITLVRSIPLPVTYGADLYGGMSAGLLASANDESKDARRYLSEVATRLRARGHDVETHIGSGHPRTQIAEAAQATESAIIVMTTRGASGLTRWVVGSVADSVIRSSGVPVLIVPPGTGH